MRRGDLTEKDMSVIREGDRTTVQHKSTRGALRDYSLKHKVWMEWDLNDDSKRDTIFKLHLDDQTVILDWEEVMRHGRWI